MGRRRADRVSWQGREELTATLQMRRDHFQSAETYVIKKGEEKKSQTIQA